MTTNQKCALFFGGFYSCFIFVDLLGYVGKTSWLIFDSVFVLWCWTQYKYPK